MPGRPTWLGAAPSPQRFLKSSGDPVVWPRLVAVCTRVLWNSNDLAVLTGRSMDWPESTEPLIVAFPAGRRRDGGALAGVDVVPRNPLRWTSRYATLVTSVYGLGGIDGFNEKGLAGHGLYLQSTDFGVRNPAEPGVHAGMWLQYLLDQAATVSEALALMDGLDVVWSARTATTRPSIWLWKTLPEILRSSNSTTALRSCTTAASTH